MADGQVDGSLGSQRGVAGGWGGHLGMYGAGPCQLSAAATPTAPCTMAAGKQAPLAGLAPASRRRPTLQADATGGSTGGRAPFGTYAPAHTLPARPGPAQPHPACLTLQAGVPDGQHRRWAHPLDRRRAEEHLPPCAGAQAGGQHGGRGRAGRDRAGSSWCAGSRWRRAHACPGHALVVRALGNSLGQAACAALPLPAPRKQGFHFRVHCKRALWVRVTCSGCRQLGPCRPSRPATVCSATRWATAHRSLRATCRPARLLHACCTLHPGLG